MVAHHVERRTQHRPAASTELPSVKQLLKPLPSISEAMNRPPAQSPTPKATNSTVQVISLINDSPPSH